MFYDNPMHTLYLFGSISSLARGVTVLHRDIKSGNILLDENWMAKVSDFGLSKVGPANQAHSVLVSHPVGTPGYCDPLYWETGFVSKESDVYSFGVVLFEILCGRLCCEYNKKSELTNIFVSKWRRCYEEKTLDEIIFPGLKEQMDPGSLDAFSVTAYQCVKKAREERPMMAQVVKALEFALQPQDIFEVLGKKVDFETLIKIVNGAKDEKPLDRSGFGMSETEGQSSNFPIGELEGLSLSQPDTSSSELMGGAPLGAAFGELLSLRHPPQPEYGYPSKKALKVLLLHGNLDIWIHDAKNLQLPGNKTKIPSDSYVSIAVTTAVIGKTYVISNSQNPVWKQHFNGPVAHYAAEVYFLVIVGSQFIGSVAIPVEQIYSGTRVEGFFPLISPNGEPCKNGADLGLTIQYFSMDKLNLYHNGVGADPRNFGVPGTDFPLRRGGRVTLYQDAHVHEGSLPEFKLDQGAHYVHGSCWNDIIDAIVNARRLVYITGWSVWHKVKLVRGVVNAPEYTLGDLLKSKSQEGVRVLLLLWNDPTSRNIFGYKIDGLKATHNEETRDFFKHSPVQVLLVNRMAEKRRSWMTKQEVGAIYTHHQKTVLVDTDAGFYRRRILAFVGGLDLCNGRYDSPQHPLFRTLQTVHAEDFHNPTFATNLEGCPREPWHDMHSKIDGPAAYDVMTNFEERWLKASKSPGSRKQQTFYNDALLRIERLPDFLGVNDQPTLNDQDPEGWHVQIFRSIDSNSVEGFPEDPKEAIARNLVCGKNVMIDMSIHLAYVKAIRSAQHFIYIETQYFLGSSYNWSSYKELGANNLIPMEIALKIASKIRARQRFAVYIVIPMWPEGVPTNSATQRILFWQNKTMQMMYETIHMALVEVGLEGEFSPLDYLNFFCLGNREALDKLGDESPVIGNTPKGLARKSRRFMIYVHSKGMIVDDEYVVIGSANINQCSMEGTRDTEIAMGAYQPNHTWATKLSNPQGQVYGYRMSLWAEHLGLVDDRFAQPESIECARHVRSLSEANWKQFAADDVTEMRGHLLKYPVEVDPKGKVDSLPGHENFPDVGGRIVGTFLGID